MPLPNRLNLLRSGVEGTNSKPLCVLFQPIVALTLFRFVFATAAVI